MLHFTGYGSGRGGVISALRALARAAPFRSLLGVHPDFPAAQAAGLDLLRLPAVDAERVSARTLWRTRLVAREVRAWLRESPSRVCHSHSRAGLLVTLWLHGMGERRAISTVRCLGRQAWLYRLAHRRLGTRVRWLGPAMKRHYGIAPEDWSGCLPDAVAEESFRPVASLPRGQPITIGAVGALVPVKRWEVLMRAVAYTPAGPALRVRHAGTVDGSDESARYAAELRRLHEKSGLGARWEWCGEVADMPSFYPSLDCLAVASPWEASSMAALEAIAAGVPVLASSRSGTRDLIERAGGGWTFVDELDLGRQLAEIASGRRLAQWRRDDAGLAWFGARRVATEHEQLYRSLL